MKAHADKIIEEVKNLEDVDNAKKEAMIEKINEWRSDSSSESNTLAMTFEKFWMELEPIFAELGLV
jgi:hypothetical protein